MTKTFKLIGGPLDGGKIELSPIFPAPLSALYSSAVKFEVNGEAVWYVRQDDETKDVLHHGAEVDRGVLFVSSRTEGNVEQ